MAYRNQFNHVPRKSVLDTQEMREWAEERARPKNPIMRAIHWIGEDGWIAEMRAIIVMVVGIWLIFHYWPISEYSHMDAYWWMVGIGIAVVANIAALVGWWRKFGDPKYDIPRHFMSPAGKFVWDNYADLNVIVDMYKRRMTED